MLRAMRGDDWSMVRAIYEEGMATGNATFETAAPDWQDWDADHVASCRIVAAVDGTVVGWAALGPVSRRAAYRGVAEVSVYVAGAARGRGVGRALLEELVGQAERAGFWTLQASIFPENLASLRLHLACGFREIGRRERIGRLHGAWRDTVLLERRSATVGGAARTDARRDVEHTSTGSRPPVPTPPLRPGRPAQDSE